VLPRLCRECGGAQPRHGCHPARSLLPRPCHQHRTSTAASFKTAPAAELAPRARISSIPRPASSYRDPAARAARRSVPQMSVEVTDASALVCARSGRRLDCSAGAPYWSCLAVTSTSASSPALKLKV
jgi:hypothetical protein